MAHIKQVVEIKFKTKLTQNLQYPYDQKMRFICIDIFIRNASALALPPYETHFDAHARPTLIAMHSASSQNALNWIFNAAFCKTASHTLCSFTPSWKSPGVTVQFEHCIVWCILHTSCSALLLSPLNIKSNRWHLNRA